MPVWFGRVGIWNTIEPQVYHVTRWLPSGVVCRESGVVDRIHPCHGQTPGLGLVGRLGQGYSVMVAERLAYRPEAGGEVASAGPVVVVETQRGVAGSQGDQLKHHGEVLLYGAFRLPCQRQIECRLAIRLRDEGAS